MPLARIVTRHYDEARSLVDRLHHLGYTVEIFDPDQLRLSEADLELELEIVPLDKTMKLAARRARERDGGVYVESGVFAEKPGRPEIEQAADTVPQDSASDAVSNAPIVPAPVAASDATQVHDTPPPETVRDYQPSPEQVDGVPQRAEVESSPSGSELHVPAGEPRRRTGEVASSAVARIRGALANLRAERAAHAEEQRRIRQQEQELRRRERETELARRASVEAEQRRRAGEEERRLREQEWAVQRLREDEDRRRLLEEEKRLAANRAAAEVERLRIAQEQRQAEAERLHAIEEQRRAEAERQRAAEEQRHAAEAKAPEQREPVAPQPAWSQSTVAMGMPPQAPVRDPASVAAEVDALQRTLATSNTPMVRPPRPRTQPIPRPRHLQTGRSRQWQRAALFASVLVLIVMIGFALAMRQSTPLSGSSNLLPQNAVQQEVPFGAATAIPAKPSPVRARTPQPAAHPQASPAPSRPKAAVRSRRQRRRDYVAQDEVIIHHYGTKRAPAANAKTTAGVRHYSDME